MRVLVETALLALLLVVGFLVDRSRGGATLVYVGFAALFAVSFFRRFLVLSGRARPIPAALFALEGAAFTGLIARPVGLWSHGILVAIALQLVTSPAAALVDSDASASAVEELLVALIAAGGLALALVANPLGVGNVALLAFVPLAIEAWGPRASRTVASALRRAAAFAIAASAAVMTASDWRVGARADEVLGAVAIVVGTLAAFHVLSRWFVPDASVRFEDLAHRIAAAGEGRARWLGYAAAAAVAFLALAGSGLVPVRTTRAIDPASISPDGGLAYRVDVAIDGSDGLRFESTLDVLEDGRSLGRPHSFPEDVRRLGRARFFHGAREIVFAPSDGTDPRSNGRRYALRHDWAPPAFVIWAIVVSCAFLNARRAARMGAQLRQRPAAVALGLFLLALGVRIGLLAREPDLTFGGHLVKGAPFSDARDWFDAARAFSRADRDAGIWSLCSGRRPVHYALLGALMALFGPSVTVARTLNIACSAVTPVLIFDALRRIAPRSVALIAALVQALLLYDAGSDLSVMTEPLGNFLAALSFWAFVLGAERATDAARPRHAAALALLGSGVALGLSNLARPLTLAAAAGLPLALALVAGRISLPWRRVIAAGLIFGAGVAVTVGPWMIRQHVVHGIWTISENTAEGWYGATSPQYGFWTSEVGRLAGARPLRERIEFYMEGTSRNLHEHLGWYVRHVIGQVEVAFRITQPSAWVVVAACARDVVGLLASPERRGERAGAALAVALLVMLLALTRSAPLYGFAILGLFLAVLSRRPVALLAGFFAPTLVSVCLLAMAYERRLTHAVEWASAALAAWVVVDGLARMETGGAPASSRLGATEPWPRAARGLAVLVGAIALLVPILGFGRILATPRPARVESVVLAKEPWTSQAIEGETRDAFEPFVERLVARRARIVDGSEIRFGAEERIAHWCTLFESRPHPFTIFATDPVAETYVVYPGELPGAARSSSLILVGVPVVHGGIVSTLELVAIGVESGDARSVTWLRPPREIARRHAELIAAVSASSPR